MCVIDKQPPPHHCVACYTTPQVKEELMVSAFAASVCVLLAATIVYYFERDTADHKSFPSIPGSIWWTVTTMTTLRWVAAGRHGNQWL